MLEQRRRCGFAAMSEEKRREISSKGGKSAHALGVAHVWTSEQAQEAGRKGGTISRRGKRDMPHEEYEALRARIAGQIERSE